MFFRFSEFVNNIGFLIIRFAAGFIIMMHGYPKITGGPEVWEQVGSNLEMFGITFLPAFWGFLAAVAEFLGGIFIALGLFFRPATILLIITMFVAVSRHVIAGDPFIVHISYPLLFLALFTGFFLTGPKKFAVDNYLRKRQERSR